MEPTDAQLITRHRSGDPSAFEALVRRHQRPLYTYLVRFTGDPDGADDLFQDTWTKVLTSLESYDEQGRFTSWLFGIAHRVAVDRWRRTARRNETQEIDHLADTRPRPDTLAERADIERHVVRALDDLTDAQRRVFLMRQHGELKFREIAEATGEPLNTVLSHMRYAVTKLRASLGPLWADDAPYENRGPQ